MITSKQKISLDPQQTAVVEAEEGVFLTKKQAGKVVSEFHRGGGNTIAQYSRLQLCFLRRKDKTNKKINNKLKLPSLWNFI